MQSRKHNFNMYSQLIYVYVNNNNKHIQNYVKHITFNHSTKTSEIHERGMIVVDKV